MSLSVDKAAVHKDILVSCLSRDNSTITCLPAAGDGRFQALLYAPDDTEHSCFESRLFQKAYLKTSSWHGKILVVPFVEMEDEWVFCLIACLKILLFWKDIKHLKIFMVAFPEIWDSEWFFFNLPLLFLIWVSLYFLFQGVWFITIKILEITRLSCFL